LIVWTSITARAVDEPGARPEFSGIYPHLAFFNDERECGTGAVVPWAGRLWAITYGPHLPRGSSDKLYEIDVDLNETIRPESVGGTPANRMIHRESNQLFIGPYVIDARRNVRVIPYEKMVGRLTANMRHLTDPADRIYFATMEEGFYDVDVHSLAVRELYPDGNRVNDVAGALLPGYHGKGAYSGQGRVVYANNGEFSPEAQKRPDIASGCLAEWDGRTWRVIRRNQFCDVTGPGGIAGNEHPQTDPIWSIGWDHRSLILMLLDGGRWHAFRLPKAAHTYDGAHGWNTEWPRIRDIGQDDLLMTMHGTFWRFPRSCSVANTAGIRPRSTYLKVIGDFAAWNGRIVFGCDDTAKSEFLNKRRAKRDLPPPGQSQSNLWFVEPAALDGLGPPRGSGAVWLNEPVKADTWSDPFLFAGYDRRGVHLTHDSPEAVTFTFEVDDHRLRDVTVPAGGYEWISFPGDFKGEWVRVKVDRPCARATVLFDYSNVDPRSTRGDEIFEGVATAADAGALGGLLITRGGNKRTLQVTTPAGNYELDGQAKLRPMSEAPTAGLTIPRNVLSVDAASVIYVDDAAKRWRLPRGDAAFDALTRENAYRIDREVCTERDVFNCHGTFYELPAENAGGFARIRPIATHNRRIVDYCSYRGMLILSGIAADAPVGNRHVVRSDDGKAAVWAGVVDDLWKFGKVRGVGGPWKDSLVKANAPSDPYLMNGYDQKHLTVSADRPVKVRVEVDISGDGLWVTYATLNVPPGGVAEHQFPIGYNAAWIRFVADTDCIASATLDYK
jgi:hypothetical protein